MRTRWAAILLLGGACTPGPAPTKPPPPHPYFPTASGAVHALGTVTPSDGTIGCTSCHALTDTNYAQFECIGCHEHAQDAIDPLHAFVPGYQYASTSCYTCHPDARIHGQPPRDPSQDVHVTALVPTWSGTSILAVTSTDEALPMVMNHASAQIPPQAATCGSCHADAAIGNFNSGQFHASLLSLQLPQPTVCIDCHGASIPSGFVGPLATTPPRTPASGEMMHDAVVWDGGAPTAIGVVTADCSTCHVPPSTSSAALWSTNAAFHGALAAGSAAQPGSCLGCHANTRPGVIDSTDAGLPSNVTIDHGSAVWLGDCAGCHTAGFTAWSGGRFHLPGATSPASCLPCHAKERPTAGMSPTAPFDFGTNAQNITHGDGQDCAVCHASTAEWAPGLFTHGAATVSGTTCVACHSTQRPTTVVSGFDHSMNGTGDCFGCHQASTGFTQLSDWAGGLQYPGGNLISSTDQFITVTQTTLKRTGLNNLVTGSSATQATLFNAMLHTSQFALDAGPSPGDQNVCWHCHTSTPGTTSVISFLGGQLHSSLTNFKSDPAAAVTPLPQPTSGCTDCHSNMRPSGIVQKGDLQAMDHHALLTATVDGGTVSALAGLDCSLCHKTPGVAWSDGVFHANVFVTQADCTVCHFPLMADAAKVDVISAASPSFSMKHRSTQLTFQKCDSCHASALANATGTVAAALWAPGLFHANIGPQPGACVDCHRGVSVPMEATQSANQYQGDGQWMNHTVAVVTGKDCAVCHASDAKPSGGAWSTSTRFHIPAVATPVCSSCHGPANGWTANNVPPMLIDSKTVTSASAATGVSGQHDQLSHADVNVTAHDCNFCHTQAGIADAASPIAGEEWSQAGFHLGFTGGTALVMNGSTGRCSNCHLNVKPQASFTAQDHTAFTATSPTDCSSCHQWPGTGTTAAPNWHRAVGPPPLISVGGFIVAQPPAPNATTTQAGVNNLPHPAVPSGASCATCHSQPTGGRGAFGYDHANAPATGCASCHEAGSDLVGTPWTLNAAGALQSSASCGEGGGTVADRGGDTRPVGITSLPCSAGASGLTCGSQNCALNHFYPSDCGECHLKPAAVPATVQTGASYTGNWGFQHYFGAPAQQSTCCHCHAAPSCRG